MHIQCTSPSPAARRFYVAFYRWATSTPIHAEGNPRTSVSVTSRLQLHTTAPRHKKAASARGKGKQAKAPKHKKAALQHNKAAPQHDKTALQHDKTALQHNKTAPQHNKAAPPLRLIKAPSLRLIRYEVKSPDIWGRKDPLPEGGRPGGETTQATPEHAPESKDGVPSPPPPPPHRHVQEETNKTPDLPRRALAVFHDAPVKSPIETPFRTLKPKDFAIRHRSTHGLLIETAVDDEFLKERQQHVGDHLDLISQRSGAIILVQDLSNPFQGRILRSVLISGSFEEVAAARQHLWAHYPKSPAARHVVDLLARPSESLLPLEGVVRHHSDETKEIELSVTELQWMKFIAAHDMHHFANESGAIIRMTEPSTRPIDPSSTETGLCRSFVIRGPPSIAQRAHDRILAAIQPSEATVPRSNSVEPHAQTPTSANPDRPGYTTRHFHLVGPDSLRIAAEFTAEGLGKFRSQSMCRLNPTVDQATFRAHGRVVELAEVRRLFDDGIARICSKLGLPKPTIEVTDKLPAVEQAVTAVKQSVPAVKQPVPAVQQPVRAVQQPVLATVPVHSTARADENMREHIRLALRSLAHPVILITSKNPCTGVKFHEHIRESRGVTVSSFNTVTLHPKPIISFNLKVPSRTWDAMRASELLCVHLLAATPVGASIAAAFTQPYEQAYDGFRRLRQMGARINVRHPCAPPAVKKHGAVLCRILCRLLLEQCVHIGDHVIVVAEAEHCRLLRAGSGKGAVKLVEDVAGLSYTRRSYQTAGVPIKPSKLPELMPEEDLEQELQSPLAAGLDAEDQTIDPGLDPLALGEAPEPRPVDVYRPLLNSANIEEAFSRDEDSIPGLYNDPVYDALRTARDSQHPKKPFQAEQPLSREVQEEEDDYDFGFDPLREDTPTQPMNNPRNASGPLWGPEEVTREESERLAENAAPRVRSSNSPVSTKSTSKRPYSTLSRPATANQFGSRRRFSSATALLSGTRDPLTKIDPYARNMTVADFFGVPDEGRPHNPPLDSLYRARKKIHRAEGRLANNPDLPDEEKLQLQREIQVADRKIFKKLAWNAAVDLRVMLDKGKVDYRRARFLESAIEKGQAVLLEEAKQVRQLVDAGKIDLVKFEAVKKSLQGTSEVLMTEAMRLRQVVDEDGFSGDAAEGEEEGEGKGEGKGERERWDGFSGNR